MTNARFEDLEKRVRKIKLKKYIKYFFILFFLFIIFGYFYTKNFFISEPAKQLVHVEKKVVKKIEQKVKQKVIQYEPIEKIKQVKKREKKEIFYETIKLNLNVIMPTEETIEKPIIKKVLTEKKVIQKQKINMQVKEVKSEEAFLERFKVAGDLESAKSLANLYFLDNRFEKSIYWSKKATKLNAKDSFSWIIYAKSKYQLGEVKDAIKSLELYLEYFSSDEIRKLLRLYKGEK